MTKSSTDISLSVNSYEQPVVNIRFLLLLLMLSSFWLSLQWSVSLNRECFLWINTSIPGALPDALLPIWDTIMITLTYLGDAHVMLWIILLINLSWWMAAGRKFSEELFMYLVVFAIVMISATLILHGLKIIVDAPRPASVLPAESLHILGQKLMYRSFPSGHTVTAFAGICTFLPIIPVTWRRLALILATGIGVSRIAVGAHWPIDVAGGAFLGMVIAMMGWRMAFYIQKMKFTGNEFWNKVYYSMAMIGVLLLALNVVYTPFYKTEHHLIQFGLIAICLTFALLLGTMQRASYRRIQVVTAPLNAPKKTS